MSKRSFTLACLFVISLNIVDLFNTIALAIEPADKFDIAFNRAAKNVKIEHRAGKSVCNTVTCEFELKPSGKLSVVYEGKNKIVNEIAFYFPPEARSGSDVSDVLHAMIDFISKDQPKNIRDGVRLYMIERAGGPARDAEYQLGKWRYVLRPNDGRDVRLYIRALN